MGGAVPVLVLFLVIWCNYFFLALSIPRYSRKVDGSTDEGIQLDAKNDISLLRYMLWTRSNPADDDYYVLICDDLDNLLYSPFNGSNPTYMYHPGWTSFGNSSWILNSKASLLKLFDCNVISVDWGRALLGKNGTYPLDVQTMYQVAKINARLIDWLVEETDLTTSTVEIIGHSLGAQSAGMTGKYVTAGKIKRITGLDPAGPLFYNKSSELSLHKSHAEFVDIIHTNGCNYFVGGCMGIICPVGHVDFFPDGGVHQTGCEPAKNATEESDDINECSHRRSVEYWVESLQHAVNSSNSLDFLSWPCSNWESFKEGNCTSCDQGCLNMGFNVQRNLEGSYYLNTRFDAPFALQTGRERILYF